jgi:hypothetical protein
MSDNELKLIRVIKALNESYDFRYNIIQNIIEVKPKGHNEFAEVYIPEICTQVFQSYAPNFRDWASCLA